MLKKILSFKKLINKKNDFCTKIDNYNIHKGINEETIIKISKIKNEPKWILNFRLKSYKIWLKMIEPHWGNIYYNSLNYQDLCYYSSPINKNNKNIYNTFNKLGINIKQKTINKKKIGLDAIFDSISIKTTYKKYLKKIGIIFCSISEAIIKYPKLIKKYISKVIKSKDNYFAALNSAVFSDGTFIYIPKNTICPIDLFTYFRINNPNLGQFERTLIIVEDNSFLNYIEGCSAPIYKQYQLHAAIVEIFINDNAEVKYSTLQNWSIKKKNKNNGIFNLVTKRACCNGKKSKMTWIQLEIGSAITWKYPSIILKGNNTIGNFYSITLTNNYQQADTGTKMIHRGKNTKSLILSKSILIGNSKSTFRSLVNINNEALNSFNYTQCNSIILSKVAKNYNLPNIIINNNNSTVSHEAIITKINEKQLLLCLQRGLSKSKAILLIINGLCNEIFKHMPWEFSIEGKILLFKIFKNNNFN